MPKTVRALAITAHYDDALIWAGGAIRQTKALGWTWTVLATCVDEESRRAYFAAWCASVGVRGVALRFVDHPDGKPFSRNNRDGLYDAVADGVGREPFDWVFTHNPDPNAEYGPHPNHNEAARTALRLIDSGASGGRLARFSYRRLYPSDSSAAVASPDASHTVPLDYGQLQWKAAWCSRAHALEAADVRLNGRSWLERLAWPCPNPEAFLVQGATLPSPFHPTGV